AAKLASGIKLRRRAATVLDQLDDRVAVARANDDTLDGFVSATRSDEEVRRPRRDAFVLFKHQRHEFGAVRARTRADERNREQTHCPLLDTLVDLLEEALIPGRTSVPGKRYRLAFPPLSLDLS